LFLHKEMAQLAPNWEKKPNCSKCNASFGLLLRQHHCRNCGKSVCDKCSGKQILLPHFGINELSRVCDHCYETLTKPIPSAPPSSSLTTPSDVRRVPVAKPASNFSTSSFIGFGSQSTLSVYTIDPKCDASEQARESIKAGDDKATLTLLAEPYNARVDFKDRTGNTLLHLACMFNRTQICEKLISMGADMNLKNPAGESPLDLAPPALAHKLRLAQ